MSEAGEPRAAGVESVSWNWALVEDRAMWEEPAEEAHYLAYRWRRDGRSRLLDLGCGLGRHALMFARSGFAVDAFDLSPDSVREVQERSRALGLEVRVGRGDMKDLPYADGAFDCLLSFHVIYHTDPAGLARIMAEIRRVLAPGGELYITLNSTASPQLRDPRFRRIAENMVVKTEGAEAGIPHLYLTEAGVKELLRGLRIHLLDHKEEIGPDWRAAHYFVLAQKPFE